MPSKPAQQILTLFKAVPSVEQEALIRELWKVHVDGELARIEALSKQADLVWAPKMAAAKKTRAKPKPTHRSKKNRKLTWSGRGSMPRWMREEMKELKLKPDAFMVRK